jgi:hypothetical protein
MSGRREGKGQARRRLGRDDPQGASRDWQWRLTHELSRCRRYNHFCSVLFVSCDGPEAHALYGRIRRQLRSTDYVASVEQDGASTPVWAGRHSVGAVLPETGPDGAQAVVNRLRADLPDMSDVKLGIAVYPDDGSDSSQLLHLAAGSAA